MVTVWDRFSHDRFFDRDGKRHVPEMWTSRSRDGMVVTAHYLGTAAGVSILENGGSAFDAAVAASMALGVCEPAGSGLGGMALGLVHVGRTGRTFVLDGTCRAPEKATPEEIARARRYRGYRAVAVPRHVAALRHLHASYGSRPLEELLSPAIGIAEDGFPVTAVQRSVAEEYERQLRKLTAATFFLDADGKPFAVGTRFRQIELARTLRRLAEAGLDDFYRGAIARAIAGDMAANGGFVSLDDLRSAGEVEEREPIRGSFDDRDVLTAGPPAGGLTLLQMLHMAGCVPRERLDLGTPEGIIAVAALIRRARRDRKRFRLRTGATEVGEARALIERDYCARAAREALGGETSHVIVWDRDDNVVSLTQSIERSYGAAVVTPSLGFLYNGYLRAFKVKNRRHPHFLAPGAAARSNAIPTLLLEEGRPVLTLGSTGSERMASGIFEVLVRLRWESPFEAVHAPRLHCTPDGEVLLEESRFAKEAIEALKNAGYELSPYDGYSFKMGGLQLALRDGEIIEGVTEPRRDGAAAGPLMGDHL